LILPLGLAWIAAIGPLGLDLAVLALDPDLAGHVGPCYKPGLAHSGPLGGALPQIAACTGYFHDPHFIRSHIVHKIHGTLRLSHDDLLLVGLENNSALNNTIFTDKFGAGRISQRRKVIGRLIFYEIDNPFLEYFILLTSELNIIEF